MEKKLKKDNKCCECGKSLSWFSKHKVYENSILGKLYCNNCYAIQVGENEFVRREVEGYDEDEEPYDCQDGGNKLEGRKV